MRENYSGRYFSRIEKGRRQEDWLGTLLELSGVWGQREATGKSAPCVGTPGSVSLRMASIEYAFCSRSSAYTPTVP